MTTTERLQERRNRPWSDVEELVAGDETPGREAHGSAGSPPEPAGSTVRGADVDARARSRPGRRRTRMLVVLSLSVVVTLIILALAVRMRTRASPAEQLLDRSQHALATLIR